MGNFARRNTSAFRFFGREKIYLKKKRKIEGLGISSSVVKDSSSMQCAPGSISRTKEGEKRELLQVL